MPEVKDNEKPHISQVNILKTNSYEFYITEPVPMGGNGEKIMCNAALNRVGGFLAVPASHTTGHT